jgi:phage recombination protein Bet
MAQQVALIDTGARLPMPVSLQAKGVTPASWRVLTDAIFPTAKAPESIVLAMDYCHARRLDIMKKPVHIVGTWSSAAGREVETIWPSINETQTTAARTGAWAGMDKPVYGPIVTRTFEGSRKVGNGYRPVSYTVTYPEWCAVTVYRLVGGQKCAFTEQAEWIESYATTGGRDSELPNDMWRKRPRGQLAKVAKAFALRAAFPEEAAGPTAEEMEGQAIDGGGIVIDHEPAPGADQLANETPAQAPAQAPKPPLLVNVPGEPPVDFPRTGRGLVAALDFIAADAAGRVLLNLEFLDNVAREIPIHADRVAEIRAQAAASLTPAEDADAWPGADAGAEAPEPDEPTDEDEDEAGRRMAAHKGDVPYDATPRDVFGIPIDGPPGA